MTDVINIPNAGDIECNDTSISTSSENHKDITTHIMLHDGYTVSAAFYSAVRYQVDEVIPLLIRGEKYKLKLLCGEAFWSQLTNGEKRMAGRCMAQMVVSGQLPFRFAETKHEYPKQYRLH